MKLFIKEQIKSSLSVKQLMLSNEQFVETIAQIADAAIKVYQQGHKLLLAGNGGSAADAQHMAGELVNRFVFDRKPLPAIALTANSSVLTAIGNDYSYDEVFSRQIEAEGNAGDMFIGISTSGQSSNILNALHMAKQKGMITVGLTGQTGEKLANLCDYSISVPSIETPRIQEVHILIIHILCALIEKTLFGQGKK